MARLTKGFDSTEMKFSREGLRDLLTTLTRNTRSMDGSRRLNRWYDSLWVSIPRR